MTKRIEIVLTPHGPELKPPHSLTVTLKQATHQGSPLKPAFSLSTRTPSSPLIPFKSPDIIPVPRKPAPEDFQLEEYSPAKGKLQPVKTVGSLIGAIRAATSSALRSVQGFQAKKSWEVGESPQWSSSPVTNRGREERFREDRHGPMQRIEEKPAYKAPKKRDLNGFMRNSIVFGPKVSSSKATHSPLKRSTTGLSDSQPYLSFAGVSDPFHAEESPIRTSQPCVSSALHADGNSDNPAPSPDVSKRQAPEVATPTRASFKAKLLARTLQRTKAQPH
jgi:hypothetical protein